MDKIYFVSGFAALFGFFFKIDGMFMLFSMICIISIYFGYVLRGYAGDSHAYQYHEQRKQLLATKTISRIITLPMLLVPLYYFFPVIISWCFTIYCSTAILNILKRIVDRKLNS